MSRGLGLLTQSGWKYHFFDCEPKNTKLEQKKTDIYTYTHINHWTGNNTILLSFWDTIWYFILYILRIKLWCTVVHVFHTNLWIEIWKNLSMYKIKTSYHGKWVQMIVIHLLQCTLKHSLVLTALTCSFLWCTVTHE